MFFLIKVGSFLASCFGFKNEKRFSPVSFDISLLSVCVQELSRSDVGIPDPTSVFEAGMDRVRNPFEVLPGCECLAKGNPPGSKNPGSAKKGIPFST